MILFGLVLQETATPFTGNCHTILWTGTDLDSESLLHRECTAFVCAPPPSPPFFFFLLFLLSFPFRLCLLLWLWVLGKRKHLTILLQRLSSHRPTLELFNSNVQEMSERQDTYGLFLGTENMTLWKLSDFFGLFNWLLEPQNTIKVAPIASKLLHHQLHH